jgi:hypothetical protein
MESTHRNRIAQVIGQYSTAKEVGTVRGPLVRGIPGRRGQAQGYDREGPRSMPKGQGRAINAQILRL